MIPVEELDEEELAGLAVHVGRDALCTQTDPEVFFPEKGGSTWPAKAICGRCPVQRYCLVVALARDERFGVWGGTSERERRRLKGEDTPAATGMAES